MKQRILQSLSLLAVNVILGGLALVSFYIYVFRGDPILAAVPACLAFPGIVLQPWFIAFFFLPWGPLLAPFLTTAVSVPLYLVLDWKGKLEPAKRRLNRLKSPRAIAILCAIIALLFLVGFARYIDFPSMDKGVPGTLQFTTDEMDLKLGSPRYYCLGGFIDSEWLWQVQLSQEDFDALATKLYMDPVAPDIIRGPFLSKPPYWWRPAISDQIRAYATSHFPMEGRGPDGWHAMATWNPETGVLHMWIKDNF